VVKHHAVWWLKEHNRRFPARTIEAGVLALEYQKNGWPHLHPLLRLRGGLEDGDIRRLGSLWFGRFGGNRLEAPRCADDVSAYAAKYLVKDLARGDVLFWPLTGDLRQHDPRTQLETIVLQKGGRPARQRFSAMTMPRTSAIANPHVISSVPTS
jgi:hypothetical protein